MTGEAVTTAVHSQGRDGPVRASVPGEPEPRTPPRTTPGGSVSRPPPNSACGTPNTASAGRYGLYNVRVVRGGHGLRALIGRAVMQEQRGRADDHADFRLPATGPGHPGQRDDQGPGHGDHHGDPPPRPAGQRGGEGREGVGASGQEAPEPLGRVGTEQGATVPANRALTASRTAAPRGLAARCRFIAVSRSKSRSHQAGGAAGARRGEQPIVAWRPPHGGRVSGSVMGHHAKRPGPLPSSCRRVISDLLRALALRLRESPAPRGALRWRPAGLGAGRGEGPGRPGCCFIR